MINIKSIFLLSLPIFITSCTLSDHHSDSYYQNKNEQICVINDNKNFRFLSELLTSIKENSYTPSIVKNVSDCDITLTYQVEFIQDVIAQARVNLFTNGKNQVTINFTQMPDHMQDIDHITNVLIQQVIQRINGAPQQNYNYNQNLKSPDLTRQYQPNLSSQTQQKVSPNSNYNSIITQPTQSSTRRPGYIE